MLGNFTFLSVDGAESAKIFEKGSHMDLSFITCEIKFPKCFPALYCMTVG